MHLAMYLQNAFEYFSNGFCLENATKHTPVYINFIKAILLTLLMDAFIAK